MGSIAGMDDDLEIGRELNALSQLEAPVGLDAKLIAQCRIRRMAPDEGGANPIIREMQDPLEDPSHADHLIEFGALAIVEAVAEKE